MIRVKVYKERGGGVVGVGPLLPSYLDDTLKGDRRVALGTLSLAAESTRVKGELLSNV